MKPSINLVVRKGDIVKFTYPGYQNMEGEIVKYPSNAQITVKVNPDSGIYEEEGRLKIIKKEQIINIVESFIPTIPQPKIRTTKEQERIDGIIIKIQLYLEKLNTELIDITKKHREAIKSVRIRTSPRYISEMNDKRIALERLHNKIAKLSDPINGKFDSDLIHAICNMVDSNKISFEIEK